MDLIDFDIERCFVDGRLGPIELGVTTLDELALAHPPALDVRELEASAGSPFVAYQGRGDFRLFSTDRSGRITEIFIDLSGAQVRELRLEFPSWDDGELECDPFRIRLNDQAVEHWATLVDAIACGAIEPTRLVSLSCEARSDLRSLAIECRVRGRMLHLAFEPQLIRDTSHHACQVTFEYCIVRVRLFAAGSAPLRPTADRTTFG